MGRPTKEQVDEALRIHAVAMPMCNGWVDDLAAEVRALREDCERYTSRGCTLGVGDGGGDLFVHGKYEAVKRVQDMALALGRVASLVPAWRRKARELRGYDVGMHEVEACADELEKACARGEPDTAPISAPDGQAAEPVVLENPAKQRGKLL